MAPSTGYVFVSYSRKDRAFVDRLGRDLRAAGVAIWQDVNQIQPGDDWRKAIEGALRDSTALLFVASEHSSDSTWMANEVRAVF